MKERPPATMPVVKAVEARDFTAAYRRLKGMKSDAAKDLRAELDGLIKDQSATLLAKLDQQTGDRRFLAYAELRDLCAGLKGHPALKESPKRLRTLAREDDIKLQLKAEKAWLKVQAGLAKAKTPEQRQAVVKQTKAFFAKRFPDTHYGRLAAVLK